MRTCLAPNAREQGTGLHLGGQGTNQSTFPVLSAMLSAGVTLGNKADTVSITLELTVWWGKTVTDRGVGVLSGAVLGVLVNSAGLSLCREGGRFPEENEWKRTLERCVLVSTVIFLTHCSHFCFELLIT